MNYKYAFIALGNYDVKKVNASLDNGNFKVFGVKSIDEAIEISNKLIDDGINFIELCGAFEKEGAKKVIDGTKNRVPIGFIGYLSEQEDLLKEVFG
ncbi:MAG: DUF6506 family protein [Tissierellia bacterium]|nr:DUF6506 family protein [Tissierellia bacterium]